MLRGMAYLITCECGSRLRDETEDALLDTMRRHLEASHPAVAGAPVAGDLLALVEPDDA